MERGGKQNSRKSLLEEFWAIFHERKSISDMNIVKIIWLVRPRQLNVVDYELNIRWYPGRLNRAEVHTLADRALEFVTH